MRKVFYSAVLGMIVFAGVFVGKGKGQQMRHKWVAKMKSREQEGNSQNQHVERPEIVLDDIEMATYHS
jgi:hypothetical protein